MNQLNDRENQDLEELMILIKEKEERSRSKTNQLTVRTETALNIYMLILYNFSSQTFKSSIFQ